MKRIKDNTSECLKLADLSDRAKLIWVLLAVCKPSGMGTTRIAEHLDIDLSVVKEGVAALNKRGLVVLQSGKVVAKPFIMGTDVVVDEADEALPVMAVVRDMLALYNERRQNFGVPMLHANAAIRNKFALLAEFLNVRGVDFKTFLDFAEQNTKFLSAQGVSYIPFDTLCGDWLKERFTQPKRPKQSEDKAKEFSSGGAVDLQKLKNGMIAAGLNTARLLTKAELRHCHNWAINMFEDPDGYPEPDPKFDPEIRWILKAIGEEE